MALAQRDWRALLEFLLRVHACDEPERLGEEIARALQSLIPSDVSSFNELDTRARRARFVLSPAHANFPGSEQILGQYLGEHPFVAHFARNPLSDAVKMSDFLSQTAFRRLGVYNELYRRAGVDRLLGLRFATGPGGEIAIGLCRKTKEFTDQERALLSILRPHLTQAFEHADAVKQFRRRVQHLESGLDAARCAVVLLTEDGRIRFATNRARALLAEYFEPAPPTVLPSPVQAWLRRARARADAPLSGAPVTALVVSTGPRRLSLELAEDAHRWTLLLTERWMGIPPEALLPLGLSPREAEVLAWVSRGFTDAEIGSSLGISFRTVKKHVEHILAKLGAENRTVASARAQLAVAEFERATAS